MTTAPSDDAARGPRTPGAGSVHRGVRRRKALETRWRIMDAALAEFTERGYHDTTMAAIAERLKQVEQMRARGEITLPTGVAEERETNSFVRVSTWQEFAALRSAKDSFRS